MKSEIADFYAGKKVLITGASGFIGKVVLEKLLRACPDISQVYLFLRPKRNKSSEERLQKILENSLFNIIREKDPDQLKKVRLIEAELKKASLELKPEDEELLINNCQLVFHVAASVQFDKHLHDISETNIYGLKLMLDLAKQMEHLEAFIFCSTAFCQYKDIALEEKGYEPPVTFENLDKILSNFSEDSLTPIEKKFLGLHENTYAFSKAIAESIVAEYSNYFPIAIGRPSIVCNITHDPLPGWVESLNGFNGFIVVAGFGILKVVPGNQDLPRCVVPADIVSNGLIIIGWQIAKSRSNKIQYFNLAEDIESAKQNTYRVIDHRGYKAAGEYPFEIQVAPFGYHIIENNFIAWLAVLWYHLLYGMVLDALLYIFRRKTMVLAELKTVLNDVDAKTFPISPEEGLTMESWMSGYLGFRTYVLKQDPKTIPRSKKLAKILFWIRR
ncbi:fatty acyl-CoA reductase 1-like [Condylostylus longicornis]|uniref:fatty acyl-CoA reductase 1-like n=1 Tax=Condylostylus longicornis TaxID=2530218 RepID=UPI00244E384C|nr:fatty acyl-CoA reductase 1-like [Condylostylus longicornis]